MKNKIAILTSKSSSFFPHAKKLLNIL